jgi:uncharacterized membrane protein
VDPKRQFVVGTLLFSAVALGHALLTWPLRSTLVLLVGGGAVAFVGEAVVIRLGLLRHHVGPRVAGVPLVVLAAWPATVYVFFRAAALVAPAGVAAAALAAVAATLVDVVQDPIGVRRGLWTYPEARLSEPRYRDVPWWNFTGWLAVVFVTAMLVVVFG